MNLKMGLKGKYTLRVTRPGVGVIRVLEFDNLITDLGLNGIGTNGTSWVNAVALGTGTATPAVGDTAVSGTVVSTTTTNGFSGGAITTGTGRYGWNRWTRRFAQGAATGNWTEVGIGRNSTTLWSRALILDASDNPTTLTIIATDILDVDYELRVYPNEVDVTGTRTIGGIDTAYIVRPRSINTETAASLLTGSLMSPPSAANAFLGVNGALNANYLAPSGASAIGDATVSVGAYINNSYTKVVTYSLSISTGNVSGGLASVTVYGAFASGALNSGHYKCGFTPAILKDNTKTLALTFSFTWGRL
jgi:hypothetical protein